MKSILLTLAFLGMYHSGLASAKGINCEGGSLCAVNTGILGSIRNLITDNVNGVDPNYYYQNGEQIACAGDLCAFCQNSNGAPGHSIRSLIVQLVNHGCSACGSIPLFYPGDNDVSHGELTVNAVSKDCGYGVCNGALNPKK